MPVSLTADGLRRIFPAAPQIYLDELLRGQAHLAKAGILTTRQRLAFCLANVEHECGGFTIKNLTENINYTAERAAQIWPSRFNSADDVRAKFGTSPGWQLKMFDSVYGNRMGNRPGTSDGSRYIGRGACQHTGREGYAEMQKRTGLPLVENPELAAAPEHQAALIAAFWSWKNMNSLADADDFVGVVRRWNGGTIGMADRRARMAGNDLPIKEMPDVDRIDDVVKQLPVPPAGAGAAAGTAAASGGIIAAIAHQLGAEPGVIIGILVTAAILGFVAYKIVQSRH
jgi:predicted chitinase